MARPETAIQTRSAISSVSYTMRCRAQRHMKEDPLKEDPPAPEMLQLAEQLIEQKSGAFDPSEFRDRYRHAAREIAAAKVKGQEPAPAKAPEPGKVINLMDALKRSLEQTKPAAESRPRETGGAKPERAGDAKKRRQAG
jgi:DNA end-binding protein Ku